MRRRSIDRILLLIIAAFWMGCTEDLASRDHFDKPFTLYGVLSPNLEMQSIRVYPVEDFPSLGSAESLDADVFSTDLESGRRLIWTDTVLVNPKGQFEYIYWAPFRAEYGHRYRIEAVRRLDGARSFAEVRVPPAASVRIAEEEGPLVDVAIEGEGIRVLKPEAEYNVAIFEEAQIIRNRFSYQGRERQVEGGWRVKLNLISDQHNLLFDCGVITCFPPPCPPYRTFLRSLTLYVLVGDSVWDPPEGFFDPNLISEPGTLTNVENGFGFIGAGYRIESRLYPSEEALHAGCFVWAG